LKQDDTKLDKKKQKIKRIFFECAHIRYSFEHSILKVWLIRFDSLLE